MAKKQKTLMDELDELSRDLIKSMKIPDADPETVIKALNVVRTWVKDRHEIEKDIASGKDPEGKIDEYQKALKGNNDGVGAGDRTDFTSPSTYEGLPESLTSRFRSNAEALTANSKHHNHRPGSELSGISLSAGGVRIGVDDGQGADDTPNSN